jgi:hypothetical protein
MRCLAIYLLHLNNSPKKRDLYGIRNKYLRLKILI